VRPNAMQADVSQALGDEGGVCATMQAFCPMVNASGLRELARTQGEDRDYWARQLTVSKSINVQHVPKRVLAYTLFAEGKIHEGNVAEVGLYERTYPLGSQIVRESHSFETRYLGFLLHNVANFHHLFPDWVLRVYLEPDLEFLVPKLVRDRVEVCIMAHASISKGGHLWRFLPADDPDVECFWSCEADEHLSPHQAHCIDSWIQSGKPFFRFLGITPEHLSDTRIAMEAGRWGAFHEPRLGIRELMIGYALSQRLANPERICTMAGRDTPGNYGFCESFLSHVLYYIACQKGMYSAISSDYRDEPGSPTSADVAYQRHVEQTAREPQLAGSGHPWTWLFEGESLDGWHVPASPPSAARPPVQASCGRMELAQGNPLTCIQWAGEFPTVNYELSLKAMRLSGSDCFCGIVFPICSQHGFLGFGGWGGELVGMEFVDGRDIHQTDAVARMSFEQGRWYRIRLRVTDSEVGVWLDGTQVLDVRTRDRGFVAHPDWAFLAPFGLGCCRTSAAFADIRCRTVETPPIREA